MGIGVARVTDLTVGICSGHNPPIAIGGIIIVGSEITYADGLQVARIGDIVQAFCGHIGIIIMGSGITYSDGIQWARLSDRVAGIYNAGIITASGITFTT
jgi:uncharacterized Zn-binding protein involved in type VI secretion